MSTNDLMARIKANAENLFAHLPVDLVYLHGSVVTGRTHPWSDTDIALVLNHNAMHTLSATQRLDLELQLEQALEDMGVPRPDVRIINDAPLVIRGQVAQSGLLVYARDEITRMCFETATWDEYADFQPVLALMHRTLMAKLKEEVSLYAQPREAGRNAWELE